MILYLSGLNSTFKPYISEDFTILAAKIDRKFQYHLIDETNFTNKFNEIKNSLDTNFVSEIFIMAHSIGGVMAALLNEIYSDKILTLDVVNPAYDLHNIEKDTVKNAIHNNPEFLKDFNIRNCKMFDVSPFHFHLGRNDYSFDFNKKLAKSTYRDITEYDFEHRFNEEEWKILFANIYKKYIDLEKEIRCYGLD